MTEHKDSATATDGVIDWIAEVREPSVFYIRGEPIRIEEIMKQASVFPDLLAALKTVEWRGSQEFGDVCPCCRGMSVGGHKTDCQLAAALAKAKN